MYFKNRQQRAIIALTGLRPSSEKTKDLLFLTELIEAGKINRSLIDAMRWNRLPRRTGMSKLDKEESCK
jgi:hypothetical protein